MLPDQLNDGSAQLFSDAESEVSSNPPLWLHHAHKPQVAFKWMSASGTILAFCSDILHLPIKQEDE